ncbi:MAG: 2-oxo acid dehydrogenase subunit E2 [Roseitalea sp.]|jgi:pyruvate dehydrogenase E2 component (dihydrolipoamide acetyltransferase)|nr:2-oxo acid dehydrogenase subunit E2 [Roseitalea sp.]MBO6723355.1 2-oxo acid dehydrogenase subunit E2 [Roseitalea sp.]MBO6745231.1 2-oxo acid dehydrogenase subunit E2 [Roseitalea sp.]
MGMFTMPSLGADMEAGTLVEWLVNPGDTVKRGDVVAVVETQKGAIEIETFEAGTVHQLQAELGQKLPVGAPLAVIVGEDEAAPEAMSASTPDEPSAEPAGAPPSPAPTVEPMVVEAPPRPAAAPTPVAQPPQGHVASPAARRRAAELGVDLATVTGTGLGGAIQMADVEGAAGAAQAKTGAATVSAPEAVKPSPLVEMRKAIAAAMARSKREIPHFYVSQTIDLQPATEWLDTTNADRAPANRILMGALFVRACALAAAKVSTVNGHFTDDEFHRSDAVHAGVAIALRGGGLVAPALIDAHKKGLDAIMADMRDLVTRARAGRLRGSEMTMGTITISALGDAGAEAMSGVIFPPQVALVGIGAPQRRPWVIGDAVEPRQTVAVTVSVDHRVCDGRQAAKFLVEFEAHMQSPEAL